MPAKPIVVMRVYPTLASTLRRAGRTPEIIFAPMRLVDKDGIARVHGYGEKHDALVLALRDLLERGVATTDDPEVYATMFSHGFIEDSSPAPSVAFPGWSPARSS